MSKESSSSEIHSEIKNWGPNFPSNCPLCKNKEESVEHIMLQCEFTWDVWFGSRFGALADKFSHNNIDGWWKWWSKDGPVGQHSRNDLESQPLSIAISWAIWRMRNEYVFKARSPNPMWAIHLLIVWLFSPKWIATHLWINIHLCLVF